jgi:hypothetical protein
VLTSQPTPHGAGITLSGDYADLVDPHRTIHHLAEEHGPLPPHQGEFVLGLAHDIRKAYEGARRIESVATPRGPAQYYAVDVLWPFFLVQVAMLRSAAGLRPTQHAQQATLYRLEACAERALVQMDAAVGTRCMDWLARFAPLPADFLIEFISNQTHDFVFGSAGG